MEINNVQKRTVRNPLSMRCSGSNAQNNITNPPIIKGIEKGRKTMFQTW